MNLSPPGVFGLAGVLEADLEAIKNYIFKKYDIDLKNFYYCKKYKNELVINVKNNILNT